jgi:hypothetical protein
MGLILPGFVLAAVAIVLWSAIASRKHMAGPASIRQNLALNVAVLLGLVATIWLLLAPSYAWSSESQAAGGVTSSRAIGTGTLLDANGLSALIPLLVPMVLLGAAAVGRRSAARRAITLAAAIVLTAFVGVASFSIGLFFLPAAVALWVAVPGASSTARPA